jgi:hypothetical protein
MTRKAKNENIHVIILASKRVGENNFAAKAPIIYGRGVLAAEY